MKNFYSPVHSHHLTETADVYSYATKLRGNIEAPKELLYNDIPCHAYKISNTPLATILGQSIVDRYKILFPLYFNEIAVEIKEKYKIELTKDEIVSKLRVVSGLGRVRGSLGWRAHNTPKWRNPSSTPAAYFFSAK